MFETVTIHSRSPFSISIIPSSERTTTLSETVGAAEISIFFTSLAIPSSYSPPTSDDLKPLTEPLYPLSVLYESFESVGEDVVLEYEF